MKLNKLQRYTFYCVMLAEAECPGIYLHYTGEERISNGCGLCFMVRLITQENDLFNELVELKNKRPSDTAGYWFWNNEDGWRKRKEILKQCIEETHP